MFVGGHSYVTLCMMAMMYLCSIKWLFDAFVAAISYYYYFVLSILYVFDIEGSVYVSADAII